MSGLSSTFNLPIVILPACVAPRERSIVGPSRLQGPHHSAPKVHQNAPARHPPASTVESTLPSVKVCTLSAAILSSLTIVGRLTALSPSLSPRQPPAALRGVYTGIFGHAPGRPVPEGCQAAVTTAVVGQRPPFRACRGRYSSARRDGGEQGRWRLRPACLCRPHFAP